MHWHCNISNLNINRSSSGSCFLERSRKTYLQDPRLEVVKELNIYIMEEDLSKVTNILVTSMSAVCPSMKFRGQAV